MDLKIEPLRAMKIVAEDDNDLRIDVSKAVDLDLGQTSFASYGEGDDLADFLKEKVGNYDYLDIDEEDMKTIPSPDVDASVDPELALAMEPTKMGRGQGKSNRALIQHQEHLRVAKKPALPRAQVEAVLTTARKMMTAGVRGRDLLVKLASRYAKHDLTAAWPELKKYATDQWLLGNVILEPELFASCQELNAFIHKNKAAARARLVKSCSECEGCPYRKESFCQAFQRPLVTKVPATDKFVQAFLLAEGQSPKVASALASSGDPILALARYLELRDKQMREHRAKRAEVKETVASYTVPEARMIKGTPKDAVKATIEHLVGQGLTVDRIRSHTANYVPGSSFERIWKEATEARGAVAWTTFGSCDHPLLMKQTSIKLKAGPHCAGCVHNYGDHCNLNKKAFTQSFTPPRKNINAEDLVREEEKPFVGAETELTVEPSVPQVAGCDAEAMDLSDEIEV